MKPHAELLPCPHCGNKTPTLYDGESAPDFWVNCDACNGFSSSPEDAIKKWNTRHNEHAELLEKLKNTLNKQSKYIAISERGEGFNNGLTHVLILIDRYEAELKQVDDEVNKA